MTVDLLGIGPASGHVVELKLQVVQRLCLGIRVDDEVVRIVAHAQDGGGRKRRIGRATRQRRAGIGQTHPSRHTFAGTPAQKGIQDRDVVGGLSAPLAGERDHGRTFRNGGRGIREVAVLTGGSRHRQV